VAAVRPPAPAGGGTAGALRASIAPGGGPDGLEPVVRGPDVAAGEAWRRLDPDRAVLEVAGERHQVLLPAASAEQRRRAAREIVVDGWRFEVVVEPAARAALRERATRARADGGHDGPTEVRAIIPGVVVSIAVAAGDEVSAGQQLLAVEAMKMQNELRAPRAGRIERVAVGAGRTIEVGDLLVVIA
jgi:biotin carboxyl carrier protein